MMARPFSTIQSPVGSDGVAGAAVAMVAKHSVAPKTAAPKTERLTAPDLLADRTKPKNEPGADFERIFKEVSVGTLWLAVWEHSSLCS
jgi:hypothetical protein